jgi:hypothetical protein
LRPCACGGFPLLSGWCPSGGDCLSLCQRLPAAAAAVVPADVVAAIVVRPDILCAGQASNAAGTAVADAGYVRVINEAVVVEAMHRCKGASISRASSQRGDGQSGKNKFLNHGQSPGSAL